MSEVRSKNQANQQELNDLQAQYAKRKRDLIDSKESELKTTRDNLEQQYEKEKTHGEAAVNHIRKDTSEQLYKTQQSQQQKLQSVRDTNER